MTRPVTDRRPVASFEDGVRFQLRVERTEGDDPHRVIDDDGTVSRFFDWSIENKVFPLAGTSSGGPGFYVGIFAPDDARKVEAWAIAEGLVDEHQASGGFGYTGPIEVGMTFLWEPMKPSSTVHLKVVEIVPGQHGNDRIWTKAWVKHSRVDGAFEGTETWNEESRFREAVIRTDAQERPYTPEREYGDGFPFDTGSL